MAVDTELTPTSYIQHHLQNLTVQTGEGTFFTLHMDTLITSVFMGLLMVFLFWLATARPPRVRQCRPSSRSCWNSSTSRRVIPYQGTSKLVTPIAITLFFWILLMNMMKFIRRISSPGRWSCSACTTGSRCRPRT